MSNGNGRTQNQNGHQELATVEPQVIARPVGVDRQEIDLQVSTAKQWPRSLTTFREEVLSLATIDVETARSCTYAIPRGGKVLVGPSVRFMEVIASSWGNLREEKRAILPEPHDTTVRGVATVWDMERNRAVRAEVTRRITDRNGQRFNDDMIQVTANAAASIAHRNALRALIPEGFWRTIWLKVQEVGAGTARTVAENRTKWLEHWSKQGITAERVLAVLGVDGVDDIGTAELATMQGLYTAIKAGDLTADQAFPLPQVMPDGVTAVGTFGFTKKATAKLQEQAVAAAQADKAMGQAAAAQVIAAATEKPVPPQPFGLTEKDDESPKQIVQTRATISDQWVARVKGMNGRDACAEVAGMTDPAALTKLAEADGRKMVRDAVSSRFKELMQAEANEPGAPGVDPFTPAASADDDEPWKKHLGPNA